MAFEQHETRVRSKQTTSLQPERLERRTNPLPVTGRAVRCQPSESKGAPNMHRRQSVSPRNGQISVLSALHPNQNQATAQTIRCAQPRGKGNMGELLSIDTGKSGEETSHKGGCRISVHAKTTTTHTSPIFKL